MARRQSLREDFADTSDHTRGIFAKIPICQRIAHDLYTDRIRYL